MGLGGFTDAILGGAKPDPNGPVPKGWHRYKTGIPDAGYIVATEYIPIIYINGVQVDNRPHAQVRQAVTIIKTVTSETTQSGGK